jgi:hypothetical protein
MAELTEDTHGSIDILSARSGDIVIYENYLCSASLRDDHFVGIYQDFTYWSPDERPVELWVNLIGRNEIDLGLKIFIRASQVVHIYKGSERRT